MPHSSHPVVIWSAPTLRRNPGDDLVGILNVAGLAVNAVSGIQTDAFAVWRCGVIQHLIDVRGTEILAGAAKLFYATLIADVRVIDNQMRRLILFVLRARVIQVGEFVECQRAIAVGWTE